MTQQRVLDVTLRLRGLIGEKGWSLKKIAQMAGVSRSTMSLFLKGDYKGDCKGLAAKLHDIMESVARRERTPHTEEFVRTAVAKRIFTVIAETDAFSTEQEGKIGIIIGDGGHGKSHCLRAYGETNRNTVYVELDDAMTSTLIFAELAKKLGLDASGSRASVTRRLIDNLQNRHIIIMLDEASLLSVRELNLLRQILVIKSRCPLILAGNRDLLNTVMQPTTKRGCESLDQFTSRLMCILDLDQVAGETDGGLYTAEDIRRLYEYGGIRLTTDAVKALCKISRTPRSGRLRTCGHIIAACHMAAEVQQRRSIDAATIVAAIDELRLPVRVWLPIGRADIAGTIEHEQEAAAKAG